MSLGEGFEVVKRLSATMLPAMIVLAHPLKLQACPSIKWLLLKVAPTIMVSPYHSRMVTRTDGDLAESVSGVV